jgi:hypothetical protein
VEHKSADLVFGVVLNPLGAQRCNIKAKKNHKNKVVCLSLRFHLCGEAYVSEDHGIF